MKVLTVIPLSRGVFKEHLTYYSAKHIAPGTLINVPIRTRQAGALVVDSKDPNELKAELRALTYKIKKIEDQKGVQIFSEKFIASSIKIAEYFGTHTGQVIQSLIPKAVLDQYLSGELKQPKQITKAQNTQNLKGEIYAFQAEDDERIATYRSFIRESFARQSSVLFCLPTIKNIDHIYTSLEKGIDKYTFVLHSKLSKTEIVERWKAALNEKHPILIITTSKFLALPRHDIGTIIIDSENNRNYKLPTRPNLDIRRTAEILALESNKKLIFGDMLLRTETIARHRAGELEAFVPLKFRSLSTAENHIIDMRSPNPDETHEKEKKPFSALSPELVSLIEETKKNNERIILFVSRRGMHPMTVCGDCGEVIQCENCTGPMTLHKQTVEKRSRNIFICHKCGTRKSTRIYCPSCNSWRLQPLGIGTQLVEEEIAALLPDVTLFRMDGDTVKTQKKADAIIQSFLSSPGSILLGTEMVLSHLHKKVENIAIISIDSLFALPDFRINERIFNTLIHFRERTTKKFLIQTRHTDTKIFNFVNNGNLLDFYRNEIKQRKELNYPPYKTFIKITLEGKKSFVIKEMEELQKHLSDYESLIFPAFIQEIKNKYRMHALIKLDPDAWVDTELLTLLRSLPPIFNINIDPEDLL